MICDCDESGIAQVLIITTVRVSRILYSIVSERSRALGTGGSTLTKYALVVLKNVSEVLSLPT